MSDIAHAAKPLRVLLSEATSTSARQAITLLGQAGHRVEVCDPSPFGLGRFSRYVAKYHRCPALGRDPAGYLAFVETLLAARKFDVLLPIHEQGFAFSRALPSLEAKIGVALPSFENYRIAHSKARFSRLLDELDLPQPPTRIVASADELRAAAHFPCVIKTAVGTASRGVWIVREHGELRDALRDLGATDGFAGDVLLQDFVEGAVEQSQAVFCHGRLLGLHAYRRIAEGAGGGAAIKQSVRRPALREQVVRIGESLNWHGALSVDTIQTAEDAEPLLIDCNPRLVEPFSASLAGVDLLGLLLRVSQGETPPPASESRIGVLSHLAMQALLGCALRGGSRGAIVRECALLAGARPPYAGSVEELTPLRLDWISTVPLAVTASILLASPGLAAKLASKGWGDHLLDADSIAAIEHADFGGP
jgi:hypothetical protein